MSKLATPVTSYQNWIFLSTGVDVYGYQGTQGWVDVGTRRSSGLTLLNRVEGDGCETSGGRCGSSVG